MRISTTTIESFRLWSQPDQDWMTEESLHATIRGEFTPTPAVLLGQAFGKVLEDPDRFLVPGGFECQGHRFSLDMMAPALALMDRRGLYEVKATKQYGAHTVVAKADQIVGAHLLEHKTTLSSFSFEKYADSCQWRFMADIFQPSRITYHVFLLSLLSEEDCEYSLKGIESFDLYPYAALHADCCALLDDFVRYVTVRGLDGILQAREERSASWAA